MTSCIGEISASIQKSCAHPLVKGDSPRALIIPAGVATITFDSAVPNKVISITLADAKQAIAIENNTITPFEGSANSTNTDDGERKIEKLFTFRVPYRGAEMSHKIIDPILQSLQGYIVIREKVDKVGDGSFVVDGAESPMRATEDAVSQSETENGGAVVVNLSCVESRYEYALVPTDTQSEGTYAAAKEVFDKLWANAAAVLY